jgi:hypothetical protein
MGIGCNPAFVSSVATFFDSGPAVLKGSAAVAMLAASSIASSAGVLVLTGLLDPRSGCLIFGVWCLRAEPARSATDKSTRSASSSKSASPSPSSSDHVPLLPRFLLPLCAFAVSRARSGCVRCEMANKPPRRGRCGSRPSARSARRLRSQLHFSSRAISASSRRLLGSRPRDGEEIASTAAGLLATGEAAGTGAMGAGAGAGAGAGTGAGAAAALTSTTLLARDRMATGGSSCWTAAGSVLLDARERIGTEGSSFCASAGSVLLDARERIGTAGSSFCASAGSVSLAARERIGT